MRFLILVAILAVSGCAAEPRRDSSARESGKPAPGPVQRLADPDPAVRAGARQELLRLDSLSSPRLRLDARRTEDPEVRKELLEIADLLEAQTWQAAKEWLPEAQNLAIEGLENSIPSPCAVFLCWLSSPGECTTSQGSNRVLRPEDVRWAGRAWLMGYTLADFAQDSDAWRDFLERNIGCSATELRLRGLEQRGYAVVGGDPNLVAREFVRAGGASFLRESRDSWGRYLAPVDLRDRSFSRLLPSVFAFPATDDSSPPGLTQALEWIELNAGCFAWEQGRLVSHAGVEEFLSVYRGDNTSLRLAALGELRRWPDRIPKDAWSLVGDAPLQVAHAMHIAGIPVPREALPAVLAALGPANDPLNLSGIWIPEDLEALARDDAEAATLRAQAVRVLAAVDAKRGQAVCDAVLKSRPGRPVEQAAILALARLPGDAGLKTVETWLAGAEDCSARLDVAVALARRGRSAGFEVILQRARADLLDRRRAAQVREFVEGVPAAEHDDQWPAWAASAGTYDWDASIQKWKAR